MGHAACEHCNAVLSSICEHIDFRPSMITIHALPASSNPSLVSLLFVPALFFIHGILNLLFILLVDGAASKLLQR